MKLSKHYNTKLNDKGSILVTLIITMVVLAALGAAMVSLTSTTMFGQVGANSSARAYFLAESGYRYAESKYLAAATETARDIELENLHNAPNFTLLNNAGQFDIKVYPYFFKVVINPVGTPTLSTKVVGGFPIDIALSPGRLKIGTKASSIYNYNSTSPPVPPVPLDGQNITFNMTQPLPYFPVNTDVLPVALSDATTLPQPQIINEGGSLLLGSLSIDRANAFPLRNGTFQVNGHVYAYKENDLANNRLLGITDPKVSPMSQLTVAANSNIILQKFVKLHSLGEYGQGSVEGAASRELVYHVPLPSATEERKEFKETFLHLKNWKTSTLGTFELDTDRSALRVRVPGSLGGTLIGSLIRFESSATNIDLASAYLYGDPNFLSYDAQVKVGFALTFLPPDVGYFPAAPIPLYYGAGLSFRLDNYDNSYGLSFLRGDNDAVPLDGLVNEIVPDDKFGKQLIVLWQQTNSGTTRKWLAYRDLNVFFKDDVELGTNGWTATGLWHTSTRRASSGTRSWYYGRETTGNYDTGLRNNGELVSPDIKLCQGSKATLTFKTWINTETFRSVYVYDRKYVEVSVNGGAWSGLPNYNPIPVAVLSSFTEQRIDLSAYAGQSIRIRFRFDSTDSAYNFLEGWYVDDVKVYMPDDFIVESSLMVRVKEAASVTFTDGGLTSIEDGDTIVGQASSERGAVIGAPIINPAISGSWASGTAAGTLLLKNTTGPFQNGETVYVIGSAASAKITGFRSRDNFIRAYTANTAACGTPNDTLLDNERHANPLGEFHWPPDAVAGWSADTDYFTLVQWEAVETSEVYVVPSVDEPNSIIRSNAITSPTPGAWDDRPELGLHALGKGSTNVYFDDFAVQADVGTSGNTGFVRTIQE